jgi:tRNA U34 5-methylaminomethyl-2-thiouridine-forming methyltransferase MnmC
MLKAILTADGSSTILNEELNETYHSRQGAISESMHVFIEAGFNYSDKAQVSILEAGFGTGLNALLTFRAAQITNRKVQYTTTELYPLTPEATEALNYPELTGIERRIFNEMHACAWGDEIQISDFFSLIKINTSLEEFQPTSKYDIIYYDAFSPKAQPELWTYEMLKKMTGSMNPGAYLRPIVHRVK